jgi:hypothetical protein
MNTATFKVLLLLTISVLCGFSSADHDQDVGDCPTTATDSPTPAALGLFSITPQFGDVKFDTEKVAEAGQKVTSFVSSFAHATENRLFLQGRRLQLSFPAVCALRPRANI